MLRWIDGGVVDEVGQAVGVLESDENLLQVVELDLGIGPDLVGHGGLEELQAPLRQRFILAQKLLLALLLLLWLLLLLGIECGACGANEEVEQTVGDVLVEGLEHVGMLGEEGRDVLLLWCWRQRG